MVTKKFIKYDDNMQGRTGHDTGIRALSGGPVVLWAGGARGPVKNYVQPILQYFIDYR